MNKLITLSVHQLVDFLLRRGDIDDRVFNGATMEEGNRIHKLYQNAQDNSLFLSEVDLKTYLNFKDYEVCLHGRADGIILSNPVTIEEIKTTISDLDDFNDCNEQWHLGQAQCYAYMYAKENNLSNIDIQLTYISQRSIKKNIKKRYSFTISELEEIILNYIERYIEFYSLLFQKRDELDESISDLTFPFKLRDGQQKIIDFSKNAAISKSRVFIEASTGLGKTIAITYGVLKGSLETKIDKFVFLTAKNSGIQSSEDCLSILREHGLKISNVEIIAKDKMCLSHNHNCNPEDCPFAKGYYDKLKTVLMRVLKEENCFTSSKVLEIALKEEMCPFELSLDISNFVDFLIMDYNYIFHPTGFLKRLLEAPDSQVKTFLMVDESHNMIDRSRDMYSASLKYSTFLKAKESYEKIKSKSVKNAVEQIADDFELFKQFDAETPICLEKIDDDFILHLRRYQEALKTYSKNHPKYRNKDNKEFNLDLFKFLAIYELLDERYKIVFNPADGDFSISFKCLDASEFIDFALNKTDGAIFFSGTLTPISYYKNAILGHDYYQSIEVSSPYPKENFNLMINNSISVRYKDRSATLKLVCEYTYNFIKQKIGNYLIFVPSFSYLKSFKENLNKYDVDVFYQEENMSMIDKETFLMSFEKNPTSTKVGVCVLGGSFSEGIDLVDDRLIGVEIIGVGMPSICFDNNLIKDYFDSIGLDGFTYAYTNPGINKVMQAVGRLIRSETDRGSALLIDDRYLTKTYLDLYKLNWSNYKIVRTKSELEKEIKSFNK